MMKKLDVKKIIKELKEKDNGDYAISLLGGLAVKSGNGYRAYNNENKQVVTVSQTMPYKDLFIKVPFPLEYIKEGQAIESGEGKYFVLDKAQDNTLTAIEVSKGTKVILVPQINELGYEYFDVVLSLSTLITGNGYDFLNRVLPKEQVENKMVQYGKMLAPTIFSSVYNHYIKGENSLNIEVVVKDIAPSLMFLGVQTLNKGEDITEKIKEIGERIKEHPMIFATLPIAVLAIINSKDVVAKIRLKEYAENHKKEIMIGVALVSLGLGYYLYNQYQRQQKGEKEEIKGQMSFLDNKGGK